MLAFGGYSVFCRYIHESHDNPPTRPRQSRSALFYCLNQWSVSASLFRGSSNWWSGGSVGCLQTRERFVLFGQVLEGDGDMQQVQPGSPEHPLSPLSCSCLLASFEKARSLDARGRRASTDLNTLDQNYKSREELSGLIHTSYACVNAHSKCYILQCPQIRASLRVKMPGKVPPDIPKDGIRGAVHDSARGPKQVDNSDPG